MSDQALLDKKIIRWAQTTGNEQYLGNMKLARGLYAEHNKAKRISDCIEGMGFHMNLMIINSKEYVVKICDGCFKASCNLEKCGKEAYNDHNSYKMLAGDEYDGTIQLAFPPWYSGDVPEENHQYEMRGKAKQGYKRPAAEGSEESEDSAVPIPLELTEIEVIKELGEGEFVVKGDVDDDEETIDTSTEGSAIAVPAKLIPTSVKPVAPKPPVNKIDLSKIADPKLKKACEITMNMFKVNEGTRTTKQLNTFLQGQNMLKYHAQVVKILKLEKSDDEWLYSDE